MSTKVKIPKILVACPTALAKDYALDTYLETFENLTYPNKELYLVDNSDDDKYYKSLLKRGINCSHVKPKQKGKIQRMVESLNEIREYAIRHNFDHWFSLEIDIVPDRPDIIETLLLHRKKVVGAVYDTMVGKNRRAMVYVSENTDAETYFSSDWLCRMGSEQVFLNGKVRRVFHCGLGAVLISRKVFANIPFRTEAQAPDFAADSNFATDCFGHGIQIYLDTSLYCVHDNQSWGKFGWSREYS